MPITSVDKDLTNLTMSVVADFPVPLPRLWDAYADPRQIERFWGPPEWPATFTRHDLYPGGRSEYYMTGPGGERSHGYWEFTAVQQGHSFEVIDGFAAENGQPNEEMPSMQMVFTFEETPTGSRLTNTTYFNTLEELEQLITMGMEEGATAAMGQIDEVLEDLASFAADRALTAQILSPPRSGSAGLSAAHHSRSGTRITIPGYLPAGCWDRMGGRSQTVRSPPLPGRPFATPGPTPMERTASLSLAKSENQTLRIAKCSPKRWKIWTVHQP